MKSRSVLLLLYCALPLLQWAQDTLHLNEVEVQTQKIQHSATGKKTETLDSSQLARYRTQDLGALLSQEAAIHIKSYGPGALASTAFRGGSAAQTALVWNGINIQNRLLGQVDLSTLPSFIFDEVKVEYGGSSALWGSGAVGGSILLGNHTRYNQGPKATINVAYGSFNRRTGSLQFSQGKEKWISTTKAWWHAAKNNFEYYSSDRSSLQTTQHAAYDMKGLMQELRYRLSEKQQVSFYAWLSDNSRQLPSYQSTTVPKTYQLDQSLRMTARYECVSGTQKSSLQAAYLLEKIDYRDSAVAEYSKSQVQSLILQSDNYVGIKKHLLNYGVYANLAIATSDKFENRKQIGTVSAVLGDRWHIQKDRLVLNAHLRQEFFFPGKSAFTWQAASDYRLSQLVSVHASVASVFRQPTFNEWYWQPGGNPLLKPEKGYTMEGNVQFEKKINHVLLNVNAAAFNRFINNWILWLPGAGANPTPVNILAVWSRGTETSWKAQVVSKKWQYSVMLRSSYVLSTVSSSTQQEDNSVGRQLIYTPRYSGNASVVIRYDRLQFEYLMQYTGYRFTSSDNVSWLDPYTTASTRVNYQIGKTKQITVTAACHNLFNQSYAVVAGRPMPLRHYELVVTYQPKLKTNKHKTDL